MIREIDAPNVINGCSEITTETGAHIGPRGVAQTWINATVSSDHVCSILPNTYQNRRWLLRAYKLMCAEAARDRRLKFPLDKNGEPQERRLKGMKS